MTPRNLEHEKALDVRSILLVNGDNVYSYTSSVHDIPLNVRSTLLVNGNGYHFVSFYHFIRHSSPIHRLVFQILRHEISSDVWCILLVNAFE